MRLKTRVSVAPASVPFLTFHKLPLDCRLKVDHLSSSSLGAIVVAAIDVRVLGLLQSHRLDVLVFLALEFLLGVLGVVVVLHRASQDGGTLTVSKSQDTTKQETDPKETSEKGRFHSFRMIAFQSLSVLNKLEIGTNHNDRSCTSESRTLFSHRNIPRTLTG